MTLKALPALYTKGTEVVRIELSAFLQRLVGMDKPLPINRSANFSSISVAFRPKLIRTALENNVSHSFRLPSSTCF